MTAMAAQHAQEELVDERHAVGHAVVLDKIDVEPACDLMRLTDGHRRLDLNLDDLVDDEDGQDYRNGQQASFAGRCHLVFCYFDVELEVIEVNLCAVVGSEGDVVGQYLRLDVVAVAFHGLLGL